MRVARGLLGGVGAVMILVGAWYLFSIFSRGGFSRILSIALWAAGGVAVHDALIGPLVLVIAFLVLPRLPAWSRAPAVAGFIVLSSVTLLAVPVLGRFGARPDVPSLLDRHYGLLWLLFAALVLLSVVVASLLRRRHWQAPDPQDG